ncbi:MAG: TIGR01777 family oxidoreductase [Halioglobus sp.]
MHILMTGATGFIGQPLCEHLINDGHRLTILTRRPLANVASCIYIDKLETVNPGERIDAVINLAGASLAERRWTPEYKREILASRLDITEGLLQLLQRLESKPKVLLSASAIGYYGHHGSDKLDEAGSCTPGFSQDLCERWERLALTACKLDVRVCLLRLGVVLDGDGGAFTQMARPFNFGVANWLGGGDQWLSWVHRRDVIRAIGFLLQRDELDGPFNITAPQAVSSRGFCEAMKRHKRTFISIPVPAAIMRLMIGEMAQELLLNGQRVVPAALQQAGFIFEFPDIDASLADIL